MKYISLVIGGLLLVIITGCKKNDPQPSQDETPPLPWERFVGDYIVYDTNGVFLYESTISHYEDTNSFGNAVVDYLLFENFANHFDLPIQFTSNADERVLNFGVYDSIADYNNFHWFVSNAVDDLGTSIRENALINDSITLYFKMTNIRYYGSEGQPYFYCKCKHVVVRKK